MRKSSRPVRSLLAVALLAGIAPALAQGVYTHTAFFGETANSGPAEEAFARSQSLPDTLPYAVPGLEYDRSYTARCNWGRARGCSDSMRISAPASRWGRAAATTPACSPLSAAASERRGPASGRGRIANAARAGIDLAIPRV